jgi:hypothetical protein
MSVQTLRLLIAGALFVHGVGHSLGYFKPAKSWLLAFLGEPALRVTANVVWTVAGLGFLLSCLAFLGIVVPGEWWRPLAIIFALASLIGLVAFLGNWPVFNTIGAIGFNVVVLAALLWKHWPPIELFGK